LRPSDNNNNNKPSGKQNIGYLNDIQKNNEQNKNRLATLEKKLEHEKNTRREEKLSKSKSQSQKINTTSSNEDFVLGWDPTSLGFGSINYQMKKPIIK
jgi:hypothetical protein